MSDRIYDDYTDADIEAMWEREFDEWLDWLRQQHVVRSDRLVVDANASESAASDLRYETVYCSECGGRYQHIDFGCAVHRLHCKTFEVANAQRNSTLC